MRATINGITVEGTPQEIMEYQRLQAQMKPGYPDQFTWRLTDLMEQANKQQWVDCGSAKTPEHMQWPTIISMNL